MNRPLGMAALLLFATLIVAPSQPAAAENLPVLKVGLSEGMQTRNILAVDADDESTHDVLDLVYARPLKLHWNGSLLVYIAKGVDANGDGVFNRAEYSAWAKAEGLDPLDILVYYDFNGVRWHDGTQASVWDLLFSYHLSAMHPSGNTALRVLFAVGANRSYEEGQRQINVGLATKSWEGEDTMYGDSDLRVALRFQPTERYALFAEETLAPLLLPMHIWSRTGGGRHADFGCAVWIPTQEATAKGIPECGTTNATRWGEGIAAMENVIGSQPFNYSAAEAWVMTDADVIGSGPFEFDAWWPGFEAKVLRFDDFFLGIDDQGTMNPGDDIVYDARLASMLKKPRIDGIRFRVYKTTQLGIFALQSGEIDYYHANVGPEYVPDVLHFSQLAVVSNTEPSFFYMAYNMRKAPWGYANNNPANDIGYVFRQAASHLVDKKSILGNLLQNFGIVMHGFISPANTFWYNDNIPKPEYDPAQARALLDSPEAVAAGISADPPGACSKDTPSGCRSLPSIGNTSFEILTPQADYDPVRGHMGAMVAQAMRDVGINALAKPMAYGEILNRIRSRDFDLAVLRANVQSFDPDYLFDSFHSSGAADGDNVVGLSNESFDAIMEASRREVDRDRRRQWLWQAQDALGESRPAEPLYARTRIEAYREDRFVNWTVSYGTLWNEWSLHTIRSSLPPAANLRIRFELPQVLASGGQAALAVAVTDVEGRALSGASVQLTVSHGNLSLGVQWGTTVTGITDSRGRVQATFVAPNVDFVALALVGAETRHPDYAGARFGMSFITVVPPETQYLSITIELPAGDVVRPDGILPIGLSVRDEHGAVVTDAHVNVTSSDPSVLRLNRTSGNATEMAWLEVEADEAVAEVTPFTLTASVNKTGYFTAEAWTTIYVVPATSWHRCPTGELVRDPGDCPRSPPRDDLVLIALAVGMTAVAAVATLVLRRRWRRR